MPIETPPAATAIAVVARTPQQRRSRETLERFLRATRDLLEERSFEEITVSDIVVRADRTVGSFYARFDDKQGVLLALLDQVFERTAGVVRAFCDPVRWEGQPVEAFVEESVRMNVCAYRRMTRLFRAALVASTSDERFRSRRRDVLASSAEAQKRFLVGRSAELGVEDPARASDRAFELVVATLDHELLFGRFSSTSPATDADLVADLTSQVLGLLGVARVDGSPEG